MKYTLKVAHIRKETGDTVTLCFKQPGLKKIKYLPGQYLTLIFRINGRRYIRPYSFSSCPGVDSYLEVTVKRVPNGIVSNHINDQIKEGDSIEVMEPMGDFTFEDSLQASSVYLWGVGSGITPLISIAKYILSSAPQINVNLIYGNRNSESTIFSEQITSLELKYMGVFTVTHFHTKLSIDLNNPSHVLGRIDGTKALEILKKDQNLSSTMHYICGPAGLKESVKQSLLLSGVQLENIFSEDFELVKDPKDFEHITTQSIVLDFDNEKFDLEVIKGRTILEAALDAGIELPYSCQTGSCSTCMGKLVSGRTKMIGLTSKRSDLAPNEYLLCCTHPLTSDVCIKL